MPAYSFSPPLERKKFGGLIHILCSRDEGKSWHPKGEISGKKSIKGYVIGETAVVELPDGRLLAIIRSNAEGQDKLPLGFRSISEDGGATWLPAEQINITICEPRLILTTDEKLLLLARSWPGNISFYYRPISPEEREPDSSQIQTAAVRVMKEYRTPVRDFGLMIFGTEDEGLSWKPLLTMENPRENSAAAYKKLSAEDPLTGHRYQAGYGDIQHMEDDRYFVVIRQGDPEMPDIRPGLTYSHTYQRFIAGNIINRVR